MRNRRFGQNLQLSRAEYHVLKFGSNTRQKVAKSASFREKPRKIVDLAKTCNFLEQTTTVRRLGQLFGEKMQKVALSRKSMKNRRFGQNFKPFASRLTGCGIWVNFSVKSCKTCLTSPKSMKNRQFDQSLQPFAPFLRKVDPSAEPW